MCINLHHYIYICMEKILTNFASQLVVCRKTLNLLQGQDRQQSHSMHSGRLLLSLTRGLLFLRMYQP